MQVLCCVSGTVANVTHLLTAPTHVSVQVKTRSGVAGYWGDPEETAARFDEDGFFRTGDVVELTGEAQFRIIGRRKFAFKLPQGEFVSPSQVRSSSVPTVRLVGAVSVQRRTENAHPFNIPTQHMMDVC